jgi:hypothetical protein
MEQYSDIRTTSRNKHFLRTKEATPDLPRTADDILPLRSYLPASHCFQAFAAPTFRSAPQCSNNFQRHGINPTSKTITLVNGNSNKKSKLKDFVAFRKYREINFGFKYRNILQPCNMSRENARKFRVFQLPRPHPVDYRERDSELS